MAKNKGQGAAAADITVNREGDVVAPQAPAPENPASAEAVPLTWSCNPEMRFGRPCFDGTRHSLIDIVQLLAAGADVTEIVGDYPRLMPEHVEVARQWWAAVDVASLKPEWDVPPYANPAPAEAVMAWPVPEQWLNAGVKPPAKLSFWGHEWVPDGCYAVNEDAVTMTRIGDVQPQLQSVVPVGSAAAPDEDAQQLADHEGPVTVYELEWNHCLSLAFMGTGRDMLTHWGSVPPVLASFIMANPFAPSEAARIHVRRTLKVALLPNEDPRRVDLALQLFGTWLEGWQTIDRQDAEARAVAAMPAQLRSKADPDGPFAMEDGGLAAKSDFARGFE